jgi:hypothetical protein
MWHRYVPESGNWHDGTFTRWIAALSAAPNPCGHKFFLRHPGYDLSARLRSLSEQLFGFTMRYNEHRESTYVMVNRSNTLPNTYLELAGCQGSSCRLLRHSKISALVHSLNESSTLRIGAVSLLFLIFALNTLTR